MKFIQTLFIVLSTTFMFGQDSGTLLLEQPDMNDTHIVFVHAADVWIVGVDGGDARRITSTAAVESDPHLSPDGQSVAFTSNRSGAPSVYVVGIDGGTPERLTYHPSPAVVRGWTWDGTSILYASTREAAPVGFHRIWSVSREGGPEVMVSAQWATDVSLSPDGTSFAVDRVRRWDKEWRVYRGGQNTPLSILNPDDQSEVLLPNEQTTDIQPQWIGDAIYFLSDRDSTMNVWRYDVASQDVAQITRFRGSDVKRLAFNSTHLLYERDGAFHTLGLASNETNTLTIRVSGDFPWAEKTWEDVSKSVSSVSLSPTGKRAVMESRGEVFTVPVEHGNARNITRSSDAADRRPIWSPKGDRIAWFTDEGGEGYVLRVASQDGFSDARDYPIGPSKLGWEPAWSPDGDFIAFNDDDVRVQLLTLETGDIRTIDVGGVNLERGDMDLSWSPDSKWLAYSKTAANNFKRIHVWSMETGEVHTMTNPLAHCEHPAWDRDGRHLYFVSSTNLALGSGWANTSSMMADPEYSCFVINLRAEDASPFELRSDEEAAEEEGPEEENGGGKKKDKGSDKKEDGDADEKLVTIDFEGIEARTIAIPMKTARYSFLVAGPAGSFFVGERKSDGGGTAVHKFTLEDREASLFTENASRFSVSADGKKAIARTGGSWKLFDTGGDKGKGESLNVKLRMDLNRFAEWQQIFKEAWRYQRDYFYDPDMHGRDWDRVYDRYAPLLPFIRHRSSLNYVLDQMNGELSVGHSFVSGGDYPDTDDYPTGLLGANFSREEGRWKIDRIFTRESWNPALSSPLSRPGLNVKAGHYLVGVNGEELTAEDNLFEAFQGTVGVQTTLHINSSPEFDGAWTHVVEPIRSENALRKRAWVEDNRRRVDELSDGKLAYVWVPNTGGAGFTSFNRYLFAQQDKLGAVIDERFNGGGLLDDYMVDLLTRELRAAVTNEVPGGTAFKLPAGIHGPKVLLINELAGSGGDYFPWVFRHQNAGKLIGQTTWGGLVKSSTHYRFIDGGRMTAPDNAVFDPIEKEWIGENKGIAPDIPVRQDALSLSDGIDPQLEKAVEVLLREIGQAQPQDMTPPRYSNPAKLDRP